jgi:hypothetical protein
VCCSGMQWALVQCVGLHQSAVCISVFLANVSPGRSLPEPGAPAADPALRPPGGPGREEPRPDLQGSGPQRAQPQPQPPNRCRHWSWSGSCAGSTRGGRRSPRTTGAGITVISVSTALHSSSILLHLSLCNPVCKYFGKYCTLIAC